MLIISPRLSTKEKVYGGASLVAMLIAKALNNIGVRTKVIDCFGSYSDLVWNTYERYLNLSRRIMQPRRTIKESLFLFNIMKLLRIDKYFLKTVKMYDPDCVLSLVPYIFPAYVFKKWGIPYFYWNVDDPQNFSDEVIKTAKLSSHTFTISYGNIPQYKKHGVNNISYLPLAADPDIFKPKNKDFNPKYDIVYVGNYTLDKVKGYKKYLFPVLRLSDIKVMIYGNRWPRLPIVKGSIPYCSVPKIYYNSRIVLNIHTDLQRRTFLSLNMRTFEALSCGACLVSDYVPGMETYFELQKDLMAIPETIAEKSIILVIKNLLKDDEVRKEMEIRSYRKIQKYHTYVNRARSLLRTIECFLK